MRLACINATVGSAVTGADAEEAIVSSTARGACAPIMISFVISFPSLVLYVPRTSVRMQLFIYFVVHMHGPANCVQFFAICGTYVTFGNTYQHNPESSFRNFITFLTHSYTILHILLFKSAYHFTCHNFENTAKISSLLFAFRSPFMTM